MEDNEIAYLCKKLVYSIARKYSYNESDLEDLYQVGNVGLSKAMKNYKEGKNAKFSSYAHFYIEGEIIKYVRGNRLIKVNQETSSLNKEINKAKEYLAQKYMREATIEEIALFLDRDTSEIEDAINSTLAVKSLDYELNSEEEGKDVSLYDYEAYIEKGYDENILTVREEVRKLSPQERKLILSRYYQDKSQSETSKELGMSQVQVSRTENKILAKMRTSMSNGNRQCVSSRGRAA